MKLTEAEHLFFFNLRAYDRLNRTTSLIEQEKASGVRYQDVQRAEAEDIMSEGLHPIEEKDADKKGKQPPKIGEQEKQDLKRRKHEFEAQRKRDGSKEETSVDSVAKNKMFDGGKLSEEPWEGNEDVERENFVQEELYIHAKVLIADDRVAICGSANINDRV